MASSETIDDDFANDKDIQRQRIERKAFEEMKEASIQTVVNNLGLVKASHKNLNQFHLIQSLNTPILRKSFCCTNPSIPLTAVVIEYYSSSPNGRYNNSGTDEYFFGLLTLKQQYPLTLITPETIAEKIVDFFTHADVNFDNSKKFSYAYYTLTNEKIKLREIFDSKNLDALVAIEEFEIELNGNECLFRVGRKSIGPEAADAFCEGVRLLHSTLNG